MAYFDHVTIFLLVNCEIQGEFLLALPIVCNSYVQNVFRGACNAIRGDLQEFADFSKQILGQLPIAFKGPKNTVLCLGSMVNCWNALLNTY